MELHLTGIMRNKNIENTSEDSMLLSKHQLCLWLLFLVSPSALQIKAPTVIAAPLGLFSLH